MVAAVPATAVTRPITIPVLPPPPPPICLRERSRPSYGRGAGTPELAVRAARSAAAARVVVGVAAVGDAFAVSLARTCIGAATVMAAATTVAHGNRIVGLQVWPSGMDGVTP